MDVPTIGRIVIYRSRTGLYSCPAVICATQATLYQPNVEAGHLPDLSSDTHVHLSVFTPGKPGHVSAETAAQHPELIRDPAPAGLYQEWDIPQWDWTRDEEPSSREGHWSYDEQPAGTWAWPARV